MVAHTRFCCKSPDDRAFLFILLKKFLVFSLNILVRLLLRRSSVLALRSLCCGGRVLKVLTESDDSISDSSDSVRGRITEFRLSESMSVLARLKGELERSSVMLPRGP